MNEAQETARAPVLTKKELQRWQKSLLEVLVRPRLNLHDTQPINSTVHFEHGESS